MMIRNNKGLTVTEILVGIGIVAILTGIIVTTQVMVTKDQVKMATDLENSIDTSLAERIIFTDLNNIDPSYNNLSVKDDKGLTFFDFYPDVPASSLQGSLNREVVLKPGGRTEFYILVQDQQAGSLMNYDPTAAYNVGPAPADFNKSATLQFQSLNKSNWVSQARPNFWTQGRLLMLDTPARVRPTDAAGKVDMNIAPRSPIFVGSVNNQDLKEDATIRSLINNTDPETGMTISSADQFLRWVPSMGGGIPLIRLRAVKLIRYYLVPYNDQRYKTTPAYLYKSVYENGKWSDPFLMADKVLELDLRRDSVLKRMMYFKLKKVEVKDGKTASL